MELLTNKKMKKNPEPLKYFRDQYEAKKKAFGGAMMESEMMGGPGDRARRRAQRKRAKANMKSFIKRKNAPKCGPNGCSR